MADQPTYHDALRSGYTTACQRGMYQMAGFGNPGKGVGYEAQDHFGQKDKVKILS